MLEFLRDYAALILAVLVAAPYLVWRHGHGKRLRGREAAAYYVCDRCGERDCECRRVPPPEEGS